MSPSRNLDLAIAAWGAELPDWIRVLATACDATSQTKVAEKLRYSITVVNQVVAKKYGAGLRAIEASVRGAYFDAQVSCPVSGEIAAHVCQANQRAPFAATNPTRVRLYRACRGGCPHSLIGAAGAKESAS